MHSHSKDCPNIVCTYLHPHGRMVVLLLEGLRRGFAMIKPEWGKVREENVSSLGAQQPVSLDLPSKWLLSPF